MTDASSEGRMAPGSRRRPEPSDGWAEPGERDRGRWAMATGPTRARRPPTPAETLEPEATRLPPSATERGARTAQLRWGGRTGRRYPAKDAPVPSGAVGGSLRTRTRVPEEGVIDFHLPLVLRPLANGHPVAEAQKQVHPYRRGEAHGSDKRDARDAQSFKHRSARKPKRRPGAGVHDGFRDFEPFDGRPEHAHSVPRAGRATRDSQQLSPASRRQARQPKSGTFHRAGPTPKAMPIREACHTPKHPRPRVRVLTVRLKVGTIFRRTAAQRDGQRGQGGMDPTMG